MDIGVYDASAANGVYSLSWCPQWGAGGAVVGVTAPAVGCLCTALQRPQLHIVTQVDPGTVTATGDALEQLITGLVADVAQQLRHRQTPRQRVIGRTFTVNA